MDLNAHEGKVGEGTKGGKGSESLSRKRVLDEEAVYKPILQGIGVALAMKELTNNLVFHARVKYLVDACNGDTAAAATSIGSIQAAGAFLEFMVGPLFGRLSDRFGRKPVMLLGPAAAVVGHALVLLKPESVWMHWLTRVPIIALDTAFFATMRGMLADVMSGDNIARNAFINMSAAGVAVVAGPRIAARLSARQNFQLALVCGAVGVLAVARLEETLWEGERLPVDLAACNPFAFTRLFTNGRALASLSLVSGLQTFGDPRLVMESATLVMQEKLGWGSEQISNFLSTMGLSQITGAVTAKLTITRLGRLGHTHLANLCNAVGFVLWGSATSARQMYLTQVRRSRATVTAASALGTPRSHRSRAARLCPVCSRVACFAIRTGRFSTMHYLQCTVRSW
jgi:MFS family permease